MPGGTSAPSSSRPFQVWAKLPLPVLAAIWRTRRPDRSYIRRRICRRLSKSRNSYAIATWSLTPSPLGVKVAGVACTLLMRPPPMGVRTDTTSPPKRNVALPGATCCLSSGSALSYTQLLKSAPKRRTLASKTTSIRFSLSRGPTKRSNETISRSSSISGGKRSLISSPSMSTECTRSTGIWVKISSRSKPKSLARKTGRTT